ncbi:MAG TPA: glycosyltransferase family 39 protein [Candidatus Sulfobium mesophilum]|nr:glycosyltransferase family 39 protein [Candidatus Sulfobium mesophilum]
MNRSLLPIIIAAMFLSLFRLGTPKLFDVDEAVFSEATREMVVSNDWITPTYNGVNRYDKPILFYWLMAASYRVFGINEFGARFPSALAAILMIYFIFLLTKRFSGWEAAHYAALSGALSVYYLVYSRAAVTDMILTLTISLSLFSFYMTTAEGTARSPVYLYGFYLFSALAFLTKGLIGIIFPFGIAFVYSAVTGGLRSIRRVFSLKGILLFTAVAAPWYLAEVIINGREFIEQFFVKHHFRRFTDVISGHKGPIYYYLIVIVVGLFPWISFLPAGISSALKKKDPLHLFALIWLVLVFLFFSLSTTKLPNYMLPALPPALVLIGVGMSERNEKWRRYSFASMGMLSLAIAIALIFVSRKYLPKIGVADAGWPLVAASAAFLGGALCLYCAFSRRNLYYPIAVFMIFFFSALVMGGLPAASDYLQGTLYKYSVYAKERLRQDEKIIVFGINNPSIAFYSERRLIGANTKEELTSLAGRYVHAVAISRTKDAGLLLDSGYTLVTSDSRYALFETKQDRLKEQ